MVTYATISVLFLALLCGSVAVSSASVSGSWANPRGDTSHTGFASVVSPSFVPEGNWSVVLSSTAYPVYANPAVDNLGNIYYVVNNDRMTSRVISVTPGGVLRWNATIQLTSVTTLLFSLQGNMIIVVGQPIYLGYTAVWTVSTSGVSQAGGLLPGTASIPSILSSSESALYTAMGTTLYKTDLTGQKILWSSPISTNATEKIYVLSITPDGQSLITTLAACSFCMETLYMYGVDAATGKTIWQNTQQDVSDYFPFNAVYNSVSNLWIVDNWKGAFAALSPVNGSVLYTFTAQGMYCSFARLGAIDPVSGQIYGTCGYYYTSFDVSGQWLWNGGQVIGNTGGIGPSVSVRSPYNGGSPVVFATGAQSNGYLWGFYPNGKLACQIAVQTSPLRNLIDTFIIGQNVYVRYLDSSNNNVLRCYSLDW